MQPSTATEVALLKIQADTEYMESHHRPEFEKDYLMSRLLRTNPFDDRSEDVAESLNEYLIKVVQNDSRKNGISDQINTFIRRVQQDNEKGSVRDIVRRVLMNSRNAGGNGRGSAASGNSVVGGSRSYSRSGGPRRYSRMVGPVAKAAVSSKRGSEGQPPVNVGKWG